MIDKSDLNFLLQESISFAYAKLNDRDRANVDRNARNISVFTGLDMRDCRYILVSLVVGDRIKDLYDETMGV